MRTLKRKNRLIEEIAAPDDKRLPRFASQVVLRRLVEQSAARMAHRVVNEAHVRTPTSLAAVYSIQFRVAFLGGPQRTKVEVVIGERRKFFPQLAGAHVTVVIDHGCRFARRARKWPGRGPLKVCVLRAIVRRDRANIGDVFNEPPAGIIVGEHAIAVALR